MPKVFLMIETIKWTFYTFFIAIMALLIVVGLGYYLDRDIQSDDIEFMLAKNYVENNFLDDGKILSEDIDERVILERDYGLSMKIGDEVYLVNENIYDYKDLCKIEGSFVVCSDEFADFYLVDNELKKVEIDMVKKIG
jgi:hypothetical protein